uniref:DEP domain-containing protein n=1 Tax=Aotus nancymaae TaxID=37293 RepID=A0A2K5C0S8_AOTNA
IYNMANTSKHGVVTLQNKSDDLSHRVLSAMKCLANWPRSNDMNNPTYIGFERDVFRTIFQIDPMGYIKSKMIQSSKFIHLNNLNSFKSTECLLLSLLHRVKKQRRTKTTDKQSRISRKMFNLRNRRASANDIMGGSCHNLIGLSRMHDPSFNSKPRCYSLEGIVHASSVFHQSFPNIGQNKQFLESQPKQEFLLNLYSEENIQKPFSVVFKRPSTLTVQDQKLCNGKCKSKQLCRSQSLLLRSSTRRNSYINTPVAEIIMKSNVRQGSTSVQTPMKSELGDTIELSENYLLPASSIMLQSHLERVAIDALQLRCLLLPPPNHRSQNVDMPKLHDAMGTRSLMIHTFSWCVLCCAEEVDLDELLAARLVPFLMDHYQEILQGHTENPGDELFAPLPTYSYCKWISAQEFDVQKVSTSQAAILPLKEKRKIIKHFQKEYSLIYQKRFPTIKNEAALFRDKPTIKQPMPILRKPKFHSLRY